MPHWHRRIRLHLSTPLPATTLSLATPPTSLQSRNTTISTTLQPCLWALQQAITFLAQLYRSGPYITASHGHQSAYNQAHTDRLGGVSMNSRFHFKTSHMHSSCHNICKECRAKTHHNHKVTILGALPQYQRRPMI